MGGERIATVVQADAAIRIADLLGVPRHILPPPPALPEPVVDPRSLEAAFLETLVAGADALDVAPKRLRAALAVVVARWRTAGLSLEDIEARLTAKP